MRGVCGRPFSGVAYSLISPVVGSSSPSALFCSSVKYTRPLLSMMPCGNTLNRVGLGSSHSLNRV